MRTLRNLMLILVCSASLSPALAVTLVVDHSAGTVVSACTDSADDCTLRGALSRLDGITTTHVVEFDIPMSDSGCVAATGVCTITLAGELPEINPNSAGIVLIDGYSQPGAVANTNTPADGGSNAQLKIVVNGNGAARGITFVRSGALRGLVIHGFPQNVAAVAFAIGNGGSVEGCFIGTDVSGTVAIPNGYGVITGGNPFGGGFTTNVRIGGNLPEQRNVISASINDGISLSGAGHTVLGNLIGTNAAGTAALGNSVGIRLHGGSNFQQSVGGVSAAERNVISGNSSRGIVIGGAGPTHGTRVRGNFIGTDVTGTLPLGNAAFGIELNAETSGVQPPMVGGTLAGEGNIIAFNGTQGVGTRNNRGQVVGNQIFRNGQLGISSKAGDNGSASGRLVNDPGDADIPANKGQNFPEFELFGVAVGEVVLQYRVDSSVAHASYPLRVEFFRADGDEGIQLLGTQSYTSADAQLSKVVILPQPIEPIGLTDVIVATATDADGNTSEFSYTEATMAIESAAPSSCTTSGSVFCDGYESGVQTSLRVRVNVLSASAPFRPKGVVVVTDDRSHSCTLTLSPTNTPLLSSGECFLVGSGTPGPIAINATLDTFKSPFGSVTGTHVTASVNTVVP